MAALAVELAGVELATPLIAAAGTCGYVTEFRSVTDYRDLGAITTKSITVEPREGNAAWRVVDLPAGMLNAIGLANIGVERFMAEKVPEIKQMTSAEGPTGPVIIGSIAGHSVDEYVNVAQRLDDVQELPVIELNVSCPNTETGLQFGDNPEQLALLLREVRPVLRQTRMFVKLSPESAGIVKMAEAAIAGGADGLTLVNTYPAMSIDPESRRSRISRASGGLSGPAIHPIAVKMVHDVYHCAAKEAGLPIIGLGGVLNWRDAAEFVLVGAAAVGIGTGLFVDPKLPRAIRRGLEKWVRRQGVQSLTELVGQVESC